ncbi:MAG: hypothetical protein KGL39_52355 [Patescibacteria group bacterium]|nr:hypothetical protein [Patescibacteria group bacterium]
MYSTDAVHIRKAGDEPMSPRFAVFNLHCNDAGRKASAEFIRVWGQKKFDRHIQPFEEKGFMTIIAKSNPNKYQVAWIMMVTALVNSTCTLT